jgi:alpha-L-fucosidase 2
MAVAISGVADNLRFWLNKNDFWRLQNKHDGCKPVVMGGIDLVMPALNKASYHIEQQLYSAITDGIFKTSNSSVSMKCFVSAMQNVFVIELSAKGDPVDAEIRLWTQEGSGSRNSEGRDGNIGWISREFVDDVDIPSGVSAAVKIDKADGLRFQIASGDTVKIFITTDSIFRNRDYIKSAVSMAKKLSGQDTEKLVVEHQKWWSEYWSKCIIEIPDKVIEKEYYRSLYILGSCSRNPEFSPPIFGTWNLTDKPGWNGDYHMNYNHVAPFYGLYSANRIEQADPCTAPILDFIPSGQDYAKKLCGTRGVLYPVGIGPKGIDSTYKADEAWNSHNDPNITEHVLHFGQKSNAAYSVVPINLRFYSTWDADYARKHYPFVLEVANFWEDYLKFEDGQYVIYSDAIHEGSGDDFNPILSLGLVRMVFRLVLDMSEYIEVDEKRREKWQHILKHISDYTTQVIDGKEIFRYSERGMSWCDSNTLGIQHIYPAGTIGLESNAKALEVSRNTIDALDRWYDFNGTNSFYPAAVMVGYSSETILDHLHKWAMQKHPNGLKHGDNPHGIELCTPAIVTINMMLCSGYQNVLRVFKVWQRNLDAKFSNIRVFGAFLVSSEIKDGKVKFVEIHSEAGRDCVVENPWIDKEIQITRNGKDTEVVIGKRLMLETEKDELIILRPARLD